MLVRCSQPELGWFNWRNTEDEKLLKSISEACSLNPGTYQKLPSLSEDSSGSENSSQNGGKECHGKEVRRRRYS